MTKGTITYTENGCSIATKNGRIEVDFILPYDDDNPQTRYLVDGWEKKEATLHYNNGEYYLHISVCKKIDKNEDKNKSKCGSSKNRTVLGVDLNISGHFAVTSTGLFLESADYINHVRNEYEERRGKIQQKGTRSAYKTLKCIGSRFSEWSGHLLHRMANDLLEEANDHGADVIVFEDLEGIREGMSDDKRFQQWMFKEFYRIVEYKARERGIDVKQVDPGYTSKKCSRQDCGHVHDDNRGCKKFKCTECGYRVNVDYNASKNIAMKYLVENNLYCGHKPYSRGANCHLALKLGTLNVSEAYASAGFSP